LDTVGGMIKHKMEEFPYRQRKILVVDLEKESSKFVVLEQDYCKRYLGGRLMSLSLWDSYCDYQNLAPFSYEAGNPIVIVSGACSDLDTPYVDGYVITTKSPVTQSLVTFAGHGPFAKVLFGCEVCALVIKGRRSRLTSLAIDGLDVHFSTDETLHNLAVSDCLARLNSSHSIILGPAGEHQVPYSSISIDHENIGRAGLGQVFATKNLKAITFKCLKKERAGYDSEQLGKLGEIYRKLEHYQKKTDLVGYSERNGWAAVNCFRDRTDGRLWALKGRNDFAQYFALGTNFLKFDGDDIKPLIDQCAELGLDPYSTSVVLLWARKHFSQDLSDIPHILQGIAYRRGNSAMLSDGGDKDFYCVGNLELAPYDLRALPAQALLVSLNDDTLVYPDMICGNHFKRGKEGKYARRAVFCQDLRFAMETLGLPYSLSIPYFNQYLNFFMKPFAILARLASAGEGYFVSEENMRAYGRQCYRLRKEINDKLGYKEPRTLPLEVMVDPSSNYIRDQVITLPRLLEAYTLLRERN